MMLKKATLLALLATGVVTAGCGSGSQSSQAGAIAPTTATSTTTTTVAPTTTTLAPTTTTTTTIDPEMVWLEAMAVASGKVSEKNRILQLGDSDPVSCRAALKIVNTITLPTTPAIYAVADKYYRNFLSTTKQSLNYCIEGDLGYMLRYLQLSNDWLQLATDNL